MEVIVENRPCINLESFPESAIGERIDQDVATRRRREKRQPGHDRRGDKVRLLLFIHPIAAAHAATMPEAQLLRQARSQVHLGTRESPANSGLAHFATSVA